MKNRIKLPLRIAALVMLMSTSAAYATSDCDKPFGAQERVCDITSYQVIARYGQAADAAARGGSNTFDIILYTNDLRTGGQKRLAELSYFDRRYGNIPANSYVDRGGSFFLSDWYQINTHHRQFKSVLEMLREGKNAVFRVTQRGSTTTIAGDIRIDPVRVD